MFKYYFSFYENGDETLHASKKRYPVRKYSLGDARDVPWTALLCGVSCLKYNILSPMSARVYDKGAWQISPRRCDEVEAHENIHMVFVKY